MKSRNPRGSYRSHRKRDPSSKPPLVIQDRDLWMLRAIWENRFLTRELLALRFPPDPKKTPAHSRTENPKYPGVSIDYRMAKLFHHGYVDRLRTNVGAELVYAITDQAALLLAEKQPALPFPQRTDWTEKNRKAQRQEGNAHIKHALMVSRFRTVLEVSLPRTRRYELATFQREAMTDGRYDLKRDFLSNGKKIILTPDAFLILHDKREDQGFAYFLEADRSTMHHDRLLDRLARYTQMEKAGAHKKAFGIPSFNVLIVTKSEDRARNITARIMEKKSPIPSNRRGRFFITSEEVYLSEPAHALSTAWLNPATPNDLRAFVPHPLRRS